MPTHRWYIERTVWLIAGIVLLVCTALAVLRDPAWVWGIIATGLVSINVSLTGFCPIGNGLRLFGFSAMLGRKETTPGGLYLMQTDRWYLERRIYLAVGVNISVASVLALAHSLWWLAFTGFVGAAMVWFAATGFCIMANGLYWLGASLASLRGASPTPGRAATPPGRSCRPSPSRRRRGEPLRAASRSPSPHPRSRIVAEAVAPAPQMLISP